MTDGPLKYEIEYRDRTLWHVLCKRLRWPRAELRDVRDRNPMREYRLLWNGLVIDPPGVPRGSLPMLRINVGNAEE